MEWKVEGVMDDDSDESMKPMEEVPLIGHFDVSIASGFIVCWI